MSDINKRNQQILGILSLTAGVADTIGLGKPKNSDINTVMSRGEASSQFQYLKRSEGARASVRKYGIQKPTMAYISMVPPAIFDTQRNGIMPDAQALINNIVTLRAESFNQPGVQMATSEIRRYGVGSVERKPYAPVFTDTQISFVGDSDGIIHKFFYMWLNGIVNFTSVPSAYATGDNWNKQPFEVAYKDEYKTVIDIVTFNEAQQEAGVIKLHNAYPLFVGDIQRNWSAQNDLVRFPVNFTYSHWTYDKIVDVELREPPRPVMQDIGLYNNLIKGATLLQTLTSIKRPQNVNDIVNVVNTGRTLLNSIVGRRIDY